MVKDKRVVFAVLELILTNFSSVKRKLPYFKLHLDKDF